MIENNTLKLLIVDDTPENLLVIAKTLGTAGYDMRFAEDGATALNMVKDTSFDLILLDVMMPHMDGFEVCRRLKTEPLTANIPVIFITAKTDTESVVTGFTAGGVDYVTKPVQVDELRARVGTHLDLRRREQELQQLNATKDKFIGIIAHELHIPLGAISGFIGMLHNQFEQFSIAEIRENIGLVKDAVENVSALVQNLINWSNLQVGQIAYQPSNVELYSIAKDIIHAYKEESAHKHITISCDIAEDLLVNADIAMVESVMRNLLSNAIKFGQSQGTVAIHAVERMAPPHNPPLTGGRPSTPPSPEVLVTVEDNGTGITAEQHSKLFRLDVELRQAGTQGEVGTGMGLILAKEYVERHGGRIWLESEVGQGTRVFFTLPKAAPIQ